MNQLELLAPAGDLECLRTALRFGADAVYVGGPQMQLRAGSVGFSMDDLAEAVREAHALNRRLYVTVNAFASNSEIDALSDYAQALKALGADAVIVSDLGAIAAIRRAAPDLDVHVSTQANCLNYAAAQVYADLGATRVVLGREMSLTEIAELRAKTPASLELEAFVHGAMCMAYSGRCMISAYLAGRSANRGACAQSCRWTYHLMEEKRPGQFFPVEEDDRGTTILSSLDLCCIDFLDRIAAAGVTSFKIEGRMKSPYYVATVVNAYRKRLDALKTGTCGRYAACAAPPRAERRQPSPLFLGLLLRRAEASRAGRGRVSSGLHIRGRGAREAERRPHPLRMPQPHPRGRPGGASLPGQPRPVLRRREHPKRIGPARARRRAAVGDLLHGLRLSRRARRPSADTYGGINPGFM